jgi:molybdopterin-guanine dinucleotide biosynthesis protein A
MTTGIVIYAGGEGLRIDGAKPLRMLGGQRLIDRAIAYARGLSSEVAVSVRRSGQLGDLGIEQIADDPDLAGPLAGLAAGLKFGRDREMGSVLTIPCDAPFLPPDLLARLAASMTKEVGAAVPSSNGQLHPSCALWRTEATEKLPEYLATGRRSLHGFAEAVGYCEVSWPAEPLDPFFNINSGEDLANAERLLSRSGKHSPP